MKLGFSLPTAGAWATPENVVYVAQEAERLGYHSLWVFQRLFYALAPKNPFPPVPTPTWLFLEANFAPRGPSLDRAMTVLSALAPARR